MFAGGAVATGYLGILVSWYLVTVTSCRVCSAWGLDASGSSDPSLQPGTAADLATRHAVIFRRFDGFVKGNHRHRNCTERPRHTNGPALLQQVVPVTLPTMIHPQPQMALGQLARTFWWQVGVGQVRQNRQNDDKMDQHGICTAWLHLIWSPSLRKDYLNFREDVGIYILGWFRITSMWRHDGTRLYILCTLLSLSCFLGASLPEGTYNSTVSSALGNNTPHRFGTIFSLVRVRLPGCCATQRGNTGRGWVESVVENLPVRAPHRLNLTKSFTIGIELFSCFSWTSELKMPPRDSAAYIGSLGWCRPPLWPGLWRSPLELFPRCPFQFHGARVRRKKRRSTKWSLAICHISGCRWWSL